MFDSLVDFLKTNIDELNGNEVQISSEFKEHHNKDSKYIIKNWLFSSPQYQNHFLLSIFLLDDYLIFGLLIEV